MTTFTPTQDIQPCPFCAGPANLEYRDTEHHPIYGHREWHRVICTGLVISSGSCCATPYKTSAEAAVKLWNRRDLETSHFNGLIMLLIALEQDAKEHNRTLTYLQARLQSYYRALTRIAAFEEGPNVTAAFDEPSSARIAREALK